MDAVQALADLTEISTQVQVAVIFEASGDVTGSTLADEGRARDVARAASGLLAAADGVRAGLGEEAVTQLEAATATGSVFVVRDGERAIAATTDPEPTAGLIFYDLRTCLRSLSADGGGDAAA